MPSKQSKRIFLGGLDIDLDPRLLKDGDYHHALNIRNIASESNTQGVIENIKGNKGSSYEFPEGPPESASTNRHITLFMPWFNYWNNYSPQGPDEDWVPFGFENYPQEYEDEILTWPGNFNGVVTSSFDGQPDGGVEFTEPGTLVQFIPIYNGLGTPGYPCLLTFEICLGFSLAEMDNPGIRRQITYNGETVTTMKNYLDFWVQQNYNVFEGLGITVSVIDNLDPNFNNEFFFGEVVLENITTHPNYTPDLVYAYALHFEASADVGEFFIDLQNVPIETAEVENPIYMDYPDNITGELFDSSLHGFIDPLVLYSSEGTTNLIDSNGYDPLQNLTDSTNWGVANQIQNEPLFLTEHMNEMLSMGWNLSVGQTATTVWAQFGMGMHQVMKANALISPSQEIDVPPEDPDYIEYDTIGAYEDTKGDKIYWMVSAKPFRKTDAYFHLILEYDLKTDTISTVFRDGGVFDTNAFNWRKEFLINDINKIGDILYWTSRQYGEPCSINVRKSKNSIARIDDFGPYVLDEEGGTLGLTLEDYYPYDLYDSDYPKAQKRQYVEVLKRGPLHAPAYQFFDDTDVSKNNLFGHMFQFRYRYHFYDNEVSPWSPISDIVAADHDASNSPQSTPTPFVQNRIGVFVRNSCGIVKYIELAGRRCKDLGVMPRGTRGEFFTIAKIKNDFSGWQLSPSSTQPIDFRNDQLYPIIDAGEGDRLFDAVPRSAHTQTILGNNRLAYGNYTVGYDVPLIRVKLDPQYGFSQSDVSQQYGGANYDSATYGFNLGVLNANGFGVSSFKSGAHHNFGIVYYDERGRCSTVLVTNDRDYSSQAYVKFPTERTTADIPGGVTEFDLYGATTMKWGIYHRAPRWAKHYRWFYSRNTTVDEFIQFRILDVFTNNAPNANDTRLFLSLRGLKGNKDSFISTDPLNENNVPNPNVEEWDYDFVKGDRIRFITEGDTTVTADIDQEIIDNYIDVRISGFEFYGQGNPNIPILNAAGLNALDGDGTQDGWYIIIEEVRDSDGDLIAGYNTGDFSNIVQSTVEIYRPKQEAGAEETIFFEFGKLYNIDQPSGRHLGGIADQSYVFTEDYNGDETSDTPATGEFLTGDVYYKERNMRILNNDIVGTIDNEGKDTFYVESYFLNDYLNTNHASLGRANLYSPFYKKFDKISSITYSDVYQPATSYNGFSTFDNNLVNYRDYSEVDGSIQKIYARDTNLIVIHEDKTYNIPVQKDILLSASGESNVGISNEVLGTPQPFAAHYGISKNPESFVVDGNVCYWVDIRKGAVLRLKQNGITAISEVKMIDYFRDKAETYNSLDPQHRWEENYGNIEEFMTLGDHRFFKIKGGFNPKHTEYVVQFDHIPNLPDDWEYLTFLYETGLWEDQSFDWGYYFGLLDVAEAQPYKIEGSTTAWAEPQNRWVTHYSHIAEYYCKINVLFVSWDNGILYLHDIDDENHNTFYGTTYYTELDFYINEGPSTVKGFKTLTLEANQAFESDENGVEEEILTSYDVGLVTDMTETSIDRHNFDQRENKQYAHIPFVTTGSTGSEIIGLGNVTWTLPDFIVAASGIVNAQLIGTDIAQFAEANIMWVPENVGDLDLSGEEGNLNGVFVPESIAFSDTIFFHDTFPFSSTFGQDVPIGNASGINYNAQGEPYLGIYLFDLNSYPGFEDTTGSPFEFLDQDGNPSSEDTGFGTNPDFNSNFGEFLPESTFDEFVFIKRNGFSEGDRMKGRFMEIKLKKRSRRLLEIFSGSATIFNSELSDD
jgi:hypothetical protein